MTTDAEESGLNGVVGTDVDRKQSPEESAEEGEIKSSVCCLQGCLAATAVGFSFLVALPTGILLVIYAINKNDHPLVSVGAVLVVLPLVMLIIVIVLCFNQRRLAQIAQNKVSSSAKKKKAKSTTATTTNGIVLMNIDKQRY